MFNYAMHPKRRLPNEDYEAEWEAGKNSPYGFDGCGITIAELLSLSGHYKDMVSNALKRGYIDREIWRNIKLTAANVRLQNEIDEKDILIAQKEIEIKLLNQRLKDDSKPNKILQEIRKRIDDN